MKKTALLTCVVLLCGCASLDNCLNPYKNINNYTRDISALDERSEKLFAAVPEVCPSLGEHFAAAKEPQAGLRELGISVERSSKEAYDLWKRVNECKTAYQAARKAGKDVDSMVATYYKDRKRDLVGWASDGAENNQRREQELVRYYRAHLKEKYPRQMRNIQDAEQYGETLATAADKISSHFYALDRAVFHKRTGGKDFCDQDVCSFISTHSHFPPEKDCIYPNGGWYQVASGALSSNALGTLFGGGKGELRWTFGMYKLIFVFGTKTGPQPYAAGQSLEGAYYTYVGVYNYRTVLGTMNSVHSFKPFDAKPALKGLYFYGPRRGR